MARAEAPVPVGVHVFLTADLDSHVPLLALAEFLLPAERVRTAALPMASICNPETAGAAACLAMSELASNPASVTLVGDVWSDLIMNQLAKACGARCRVVRYALDGMTATARALPLPGDVSSSGVVCIGRAPTSYTPVPWLLGRIRTLSQLTPAHEDSLVFHARTLTLLDARVLGVSVDETQPLFSGLREIEAARDPRKGVDIKDRVAGLLAGRYSLEQLLRIA